MINVWITNEVRPIGSGAKASRIVRVAVICTHEQRCERTRRLYCQNARELPATKDCVSHRIGIRKPSPPRANRKFPDITEHESEAVIKIGKAALFRPVD